MATGRATSGPKGPLWKLGVGYLALAVVAAVVVWVGSRYVGYRRGQGHPVSGDGPQVLIQAPMPGSKSLAGRPLLVQTFAFGPRPLEVTELWIDGELLGSDRAPEAGLNPWTTSFMWTPTTPGSYSLVARSIDAAGVNAISPVVVLEVAAGTGGGDDLVTNTGVVFPSAGASEPTLDDSSDSPSTPAEPWSPGFGSWFQSLLAIGPPEAPVLNLDRDGCDAVLRIRDLSSNEEGFRVYRDTGGGLAEIAVLASPSISGWLTYVDPGLAGSVLYYVAAFNSQGETASNVDGVHFPANECPAVPPVFIDAKVLHLAQWETPPDVDRAYCYTSFDETIWTRLPEAGFLSPEGGEDFQPVPFLSALPESGGLPPSDMWLECWGWVGGALTFLGETSFEGIAFGEMAEFTFSGDMFSGTFGLVSLADYTLYGDFPTPTSAQMPYLDDWVDYRRSECEKHIQPAAAWRCDLNATFNEGPTGPNPQPYILWDYREDVCLAGSYEDCLSIEAWTFYAQTLGMELKVQLQETFEEVALLDFSWLSDGPSESPPMGFNYVVNHYIDASLPMYRVLPFPCAGDRTYRARLALVDPEVDPGEHPPMAGPWSNGVYGVLCRQPLGDKVWLEATFHSVILDSVEDCDLECEGTVEVDAYFHAMPGSPEGTRPIGQLLMGYCSGEKDTSAFALENVVCASDTTYTMSNGNYLLDAYPICFSNVLVPGFECEAPFNHYVVHNNKIFFQVLEGEAVQLATTITDWDVHSGNDNVCWARAWTAARTLEEWAAVSGEVIQLSQSFAENDNADCRVDVSLRAVAAPPEGWGE